MSKPAQSKRVDTNNPSIEPPRFYNPTGPSQPGDPNGEHLKGNAASSSSKRTTNNDADRDADQNKDRVNTHVCFDNQKCYVLNRVNCRGSDMYVLESNKPLRGYNGKCPVCDEIHPGTSSPDRTYFVSVKTLNEKIRDQEREEERLRGPKKIEDLFCISENLPPLDRPLLGRDCGIEGDSNSCYMDSTLFCMFAYSNVFDSLLHMSVPPGSATEIVQQLLRDNIAHVLRERNERVSGVRPGLVTRETLYHLRDQLSKATKDDSFREKEKDPSEFLRALEQLFSYAPLKTVPFDQAPKKDGTNLTSNIIWEMFDANTEQLPSINIGSIFRNSLKEIPAKLATIPPFLVLVAPRHQRSQRSYKCIVPDQKIVLDTTVLQTACAQCGKVDPDRQASNILYSCTECFTTAFDSFSPTTDATIQCLCFACLAKHHDKVLPKDQRHEHHVTKISDKQHALHLFAVLCIETSHYVAFVKCQTQSQKHKWLFFDSMSDRRGNEQNIPCVDLVPNFDEWIANAQNDKNYFEDLMNRRRPGVPMSQTFDENAMRQVRLFRDGAFFFYENPIANYQ